MGTYHWSQQSKVTSDKVRAYISSVNFASLNAAQRNKAIAELARQVNALSSEERIKLHLQRAWENWFLQMTEEERTRFVEATLPTGITQMMTAFEQMPDAARKKTIEDAMKRLRDAHELPIPKSPSEHDQPSTNSTSPLSAELEQRMQSVGLKTFYTKSSAQTKAEVAPVLEEMQRLMEHGIVLR